MKLTKNAMKNAIGMVPFGVLSSVPCWPSDMDHRKADTVVNQLTFGDLCGPDFNQVLGHFGPGFGPSWTKLVLATFANPVQGENMWFIRLNFSCQGATQ